MINIPTQPPAFAEKVNRGMEKATDLVLKAVPGLDCFIGDYGSDARKKDLHAPRGN